LSEPRTHYQVSFTSRQAVLLFVLLLASLAGAYFLGIATGISGRLQGEPAQPTPAPSPVAAAAAEIPAPVFSPKAVPAAPASRPEARATASTVASAREPTTGEGIQFFEDRPEEPTPAGSAPAPTRRAAPAAPAQSGFWVQVLSTSSESEAKSRRVRLAAHGYQVSVSPVQSARGSVLYRVRIGPYASREEASTAAVEIARRERVSPWIAPPGE
jgi:DedD protein